MRLKFLILNAFWYPTFTCSLHITPIQKASLLIPRVSTCRPLCGAKKCFIHLGISVSVVLGVLFHPTPASALNEQQQVVAEVWRTVDRLYFDRTFGGVDWFELRQRTINSVSNPMSEKEFNQHVADMLQELGDKYTRYLPAAKYQTIVQSASGELGGIGITIGTEGNYPVIIDVEKGTPAEKANLKSGDLLVECSGEDLYGYTPDDAAALLRGPEGSRVGVKATRKVGSSTEVLDLILNRAKFKIQGVVGRSISIDGKLVGIIRIKSFSANTALDVLHSIQDIRKSGPIQALILDLRGNVGGLLPGGVDTARLFLPPNTDIVFVVGKSGVLSVQNTGANEGPEVGVPLVLLVDGRTASASEVLSAALQENGRARLVGSQTFGKGIIQTVEPLSGGAGVAVTVARYETPKRHDINGRGIPVDVEISCLPDAQVENCLTPKLLFSQ